MTARKDAAKPKGAGSGDDLTVEQAKVETDGVKLRAGRKQVVRVELDRVFRLALLDDDGAPRAGVRWRFEIEGKKHEGKTGADGVIAQPIRGAAEKGKLSLWDDPDAEQPAHAYDVELAEPPPVTDPKGVQVRLASLGFYHGPIDAKTGPGTETREAVRAFQQEHMDRDDAHASGEVDDETRRALVALCDEE